jgi:hypothetical protein
MLLGRCEGRTTLGRPRHSWGNNIKINIQEVTWGGGAEFDWAGSEQGQVVGSCEYGNEPMGSIK